MEVVIINKYDCLNCGQYIYMDKEPDFCPICENNEFTKEKGIFEVHEFK